MNFGTFLQRDGFLRDCCGWVLSKPDCSKLGSKTKNFPGGNYGEKFSSVANVNSISHYIQTFEQVVSHLNFVLCQTSNLILKYLSWTLMDFLTDVLENEGTTIIC
ncbi:hypothetical protein NQD34_000630 [Periophthalmus magnuspinnatus]|nr:hypothetical protein NQD34_000630 [Periophthalmus magnuspinnatus]